MTVMIEGYVKHVSNKEYDLQVYETDASGIKGTAALVVWPENEEEVRKTILYSKRTHHDVTIRGAGSGLAGGAVPQNSIVLDMSRMNKAIAFDKKTATVQAGVVVDDLNKGLEKGGLYFPVCPLNSKVATVGGMLATNCLGLRSNHYGKLDKWVEEVRFIDGFGRLKKTKDMKDFLGKEGTTGVITSAKLRLTEIPELVTMNFLSFKNITEFIDETIRLKESPDVSSITFFDRICSRVLGLGDKNHLLVEYLSNQGKIKDEEEIKGLLKLKESLPTMLLSKNFVSVHDPMFKIENVDKFLYWLGERKIPCYADLAFGVVFVHLKEGDRYLDKMYKIIASLKGTVPGCLGVGLRKKGRLDKELVLEFMSSRQEYDPRKTFNRGKVYD